MSITNNNEYGSMYPRYSKVEIWEHVIKYRKTILIWREFVKSLIIELYKQYPNTVDHNKILLFIEDTLQYLENKESENYKTKRIKA